MENIHHTTNDRTRRRLGRWAAGLTIAAGIVVPATVAGAEHVAVLEDPVEVTVAPPTQVELEPVGQPGIDVLIPPPSIPEPPGGFPGNIPGPGVLIPVDPPEDPPVVPPFEPGDFPLQPQPEPTDPGGPDDLANPEDPGDDPEDPGDDPGDTPEGDEPDGAESDDRTLAYTGSTPAFAVAAGVLGLAGSGLVGASAFARRRNRDQ